MDSSLPSLPPARLKSRQESKFLSLASELRILIYQFVAVNDVEAFVESAKKPTLIRTSRQLEREYGDVFFESAALQLDAYDSTWSCVQSEEVKRAIFADCVFTELSAFCSLGSAKMYCQRLFFDWQGHIATGIATLNTSSGVRRWQWSTVRCPDVDTACY
jgi:hypothetical protein